MFIVCSFHPSENWLIITNNRNISHLLLNFMIKVLSLEDIKPSSSNLLHKNFNHFSNFPVNRQNYWLGKILLTFIYLNLELFKFNWEDCQCTKSSKKLSKSPRKQSKEVFSFRKTKCFNPFISQIGITVTTKQTLI